MINDTIWSTLLSDLTQLLFFFITNYPTRKNIFQVINYHGIKILKENEHFTSYQFAINQDYQKRTDIKQDISYNLT